MKYVHIYANIISTTIQQGELSHRTVGRSADKLMVRGLQNGTRPVDLHLFSAHDPVPYPNYAHIYVYTVYIYIISSNSSIIFIIEIHKTWIKHIPLICVASHHPADKPTAPQRCWSELPGQRGKCRGNQGAVSCQNLEKHWKMHQNCPSKKSNDVKWLSRFFLFLDATRCCHL